jgi:cbb3-type cytochrome oxidase subunit 1
MLRWRCDYIFFNRENHETKLLALAFTSFAAIKNGETMRASTLSFCSAVCLGIVGMIIGIIMAASNNHSVYPAHAHLNLIGWVSLFLIGIFYRFHPVLDRSRVAIIQVGFWVCGTIILTCGVAGIFLGRTDLEPIAIAGSLIVLGDMLLFAYLVFRYERSIMGEAGT